MIVTLLLFLIQFKAAEETVNAEIKKIARAMKTEFKNIIKKEITDDLETNLNPMDEFNLFFSIETILTLEFIRLGGKRVKKYRSLFANCKNDDVMFMFYYFNKQKKNLKERCCTYYSPKNSKRSLISVNYAIKTFYISFIMYLNSNKKEIILFKKIAKYYHILMNNKDGWENICSGIVSIIKMLKKEGILSEFDVTFFKIAEKDFNTYLEKKKVKLN